VAISFSSFVGQNWLITPAALAVNEAPPSSINEQKWVIVYTGVGFVDLRGNANAWHKEVLIIWPDVAAPLRHVIQKYNIQPPVPQPAGVKFTPQIELDQWAPFAAVSASSAKGTDDVGFEVDVWRPNPFFHGNDVSGTHYDHIFTGIQVEIAVRTDRALMHEVSYHFTLLGKIVFFETR
jgi:hypothetical protein